MDEDPLDVDLALERLAGLSRSTAAYTMAAGSITGSASPTCCRGSPRPAVEALVHRLQHVITRKQEQVDTLVRARRGT